MSIDNFAGDIGRTTWRTEAFLHGYPRTIAFADRRVGYGAPTLRGQMAWASAAMSSLRPSQSRQHNSTAVPLCACIPYVIGGASRRLHLRAEHPNSRREAS